MKGSHSNTASQLLSITLTFHSQNTHNSMLRSSPAKALPFYLIPSDHSHPHSFSSHTRTGNHTCLVLQATSILSFLSPLDHLSVSPFLYLLIIHFFSACVLFVGSFPLVNYSRFSQSLFSMPFISYFALRYLGIMLNFGESIIVHHPCPRCSKSRKESVYLNGVIQVLVTVHALYYPRRKHCKSQTLPRLGLVTW